MPVYFADPFETSLLAVWAEQHVHLISAPDQSESKQMYHFIREAKGQLISEWLVDVLNFPKKPRKIWWISALESKKRSNKKDKGTLLC